MGKRMGTFFIYMKDLGFFTTFSSKDKFNVSSNGPLIALQSLSTVAPRIFR